MTTKVKLILMKGISCASKSTTVKELKDKYNAVVLSSDTLREEYGLSNTDNAVFKIIDDKALENLSKGISVIIDATNLSMKKHRRYKALANKTKADLICHYVITHPEIWELHAKNRIETKWTNLTMDDMFDIRKKMFQGLSFPMKSEFDEIYFHIKDISVEDNLINEFKTYYNNNLDLFLNNTKAFLQPLYDNGLLEKVLPEVYNMYGYDQQNIHHKLTLENHTFKVCDSLKNKTEENIWSALLHDVGKLTKGIKSIKSTGDYSYIGHAGASSEMSMCILNRLKFELDFSAKVSTIINKHMYLPYEGTLKKSKIDIIGEDLYKTLKEFRIADINAKTE